MTLDTLPMNVIGVQVVQTRRGKTMPHDPYSQWNLCDYTGDDARRVHKARIAFCRELGITPDRLVMPKQSHTAHVAIIDDAYMRLVPEQRELYLTDVDALVTSLPGFCLGVNTADCIPIAMADAQAGVIAIVHAGWRGSVSHIAHEAVKSMQQQGAHPRNIHATMGASICAYCFEVGDEVVSAFEQAGFPLDRIMTREPGTGKAHIDLRQANRFALIDAGLSPDHIVLPDACSHCQTEQYFSARRLGIRSGRTFTAILRRT